MDISKYSTPEQIERRIAQCVKQRDHAADVMGNLVLAMTYQLEINELVDKRDALPRQLHADCPACGVGLNIEVPKAKPQAVRHVTTTCECGQNPTCARCGGDGSYMREVQPAPPSVKPMDRQNLRNLIGGHDCEPDAACSDSLAIVLVTYFENLLDDPKSDRGEDGWSARAVARCNSVLDRLTDAVLALAAKEQR